MKRAAAALLAVALLGGCKKEPLPIPPSDGAAPAPSSSAVVIDASVTDADADVADAAPFSDVDLAASKDLRVLIPKKAPEGALPLLVRAVDGIVKATADDAGPPVRIVVYADTTIDYGCLCPPFVFAPFYNTGRPDGYVLPVFAPNVPDPPLTKQGLYRFAGRFDGRRITGFDWLKLRKEKREEGMDEYAKKAPVFVVDGWCFEPNAEASDPEIASVYRPTLEKLAKDGRLCPGTRLPPAPKKK